MNITSLVVRDAMQSGRFVPVCFLSRKWSAHFFKNSDEDIPDYMMSPFRRQYISVVCDELCGIFTLLSLLSL
jgi:hypothetical protein